MEISEAKVGDTVICLSRYNKSLNTVERLTKTQIIISNSNIKFNRKTGSQIGDWSFGNSRIEMPTEEEIAIFKKEIRTENIAYELNDYNFSKLELTKLELINKIIEESKEQKETS